jgi:hypothetical protein
LLNTTAKQLFAAEARIEELTDQSASKSIRQKEMNRYHRLKINMVIPRQSDELLLQNLILKIRLDLLSAKLALVSDDPQLASQELSETGGRIADLKILAGVQQQKNVENLETRLELVLSEMEEETFAAISDLEVMLEILEELES